MRPTRTLGGLALAAGLLVSACSAGATPTPVASTAASPATSPSPAASSGSGYGGGSSPAASPGAAGSTVMLADTSLGKVLVDGQGRTLYLFTKDTSTTPTCYDQCAASWPPLTATGSVTVGTGLDQSDFSTSPRTDGSQQVTFYGHPLYYFGGDATAGDTKGEGLNGVWFVVGPEGTAIKGG